MESIKEKKMFWIIIVLAFITRSWGLLFHSLWFDEACTALAVSQDSWSSFYKVITSFAGTPLLFYILERLVSIVFGGVNHFTLRFLPLVFSVIGCGVFYLLNIKISEKKAALWPSLYLIFATFYVFLSQNARTYSIFMLFIFLVLYTLFQWLEDLKNKKKMTLYIISVIMLVNIHYYGMSFLISLNFTLILIYFKRIKEFAKPILAGITVMVISFISILPIFLKQLESQTGGEKTYLTSKWLFGIIYSPVKILLGSFLFKIHTVKFLTLFNVVIIIFYGIVVVYSAFVFIKRLKERKVNIFEVIVYVTMAFTFLAHILISWKMPTLHPMYNAQFLVFIFSFIGINLYYSKVKIISKLFLTVLLIVYVFGTYNHYFHKNHYIQPWKEITLDLQNEMEKRGKVEPVLLRFMTGHTMGYYLNNDAEFYEFIWEDMDTKYNLSKINLFGHDSFLLFESKNYKVRKEISLRGLLKSEKSGYIVAANVFEYGKSNKERLSKLVEDPHINLEFLKSYSTNQEDIDIVYWTYQD